MPNKNPDPDPERESERPVEEVAEFLVTFMRRVMDLKPEWERYERELIDQSFAAPSADRMRSLGEHPAEIWDRLRSDEAVVAHADYALLRSGLGRKGAGGAPVASLVLHVEWFDDNLWVRGSQLPGSLGLAFRWGEVWEHSDVLALSAKAERHPIPLELIERDAVQIISFNATSVTGVTVLRRETLAATTGA